jgi:hypothetical protein
LAPFLSAPWFQCSLDLVGWIASGIPAFSLAAWVFGVAAFAAPEIRQQLLWMPTLLFIYSVTQKMFST